MHGSVSMTVPASDRPGESSSERANERWVILMTPSEKARYAEHANHLGLSLGQFFREAGAACAPPTAEATLEQDALEAALRQLELSTASTEAVLDPALSEVRAALEAPQPSPAP